jgi:hypothetical protein
VRPLPLAAASRQQGGSLELAGVTTTPYVAEDVQVIELRTVYTADLDAGVRSAIRELLDTAFDNFTDDAFDNVLGAVHALILEDAELTAHSSGVQRCMLHGGRALRTGYIEGVAVRGACWNSMN